MSLCKQHANDIADGDGNALLFAFSHLMRARVVGLISSRETIRTQSYLRVQQVFGAFSSLLVYLFFVLIIDGKVPPRA